MGVIEVILSIVNLTAFMKPDNQNSKILTDNE